MGKIKIVFFDVDGTLRPLDGHVLPSTQEAFKKLHEAGIKTCIASGRGFKSLDQEIRGLSPDYFITVTGQYAQTAAGEEIYSNPISKMVLGKIVAWAAVEHFELLFVGARESAISKWNELSRTCMTHGYEEVGENPDFWRTNDVYQLLTVAPAKQKLVLPDELKEEIYLNQWHPFSYDICAKNSSKAIGVQRVLNYLHLKETQAMAFGDSANDLPMFSAVGCGIAMENATEELKKAANYITASTYADGIFNALEKFALI